jgi:hypothetical protein
MTATDFHAAYLKLSAARHEKVCRLAATYLCHPFFPTAIDLCRHRKCRRDGVCSGAMRPSAHLIAQSQLLQKHGLSSTRGTELPACLVAGGDRLFAAYEDSRKVFSNDPAQQPELFWPDFAMFFKLERNVLRKRGGATADTGTPPAGHV